MPVARAWSVAVVGIEGHLIEVEADIGQGLPGFHLVGLPDTAVHEARDRARAAVANSEEAWPNRRITVNLSPASLPKQGTTFDLALAGAVLAAADALPAGVLEKVVLLGELGLDGSVRGIRGVLPAMLAATTAGFTSYVVPRANAAEAELVPDVQVAAVGSLAELLARLRGDPWTDPDQELAFEASAGSERPAGGGHTALRLPDASDKDLADVAGQAEARMGLELSAAGGHHIFLHGSPGTGKTMLAERLPGLLPPLERDAALEVTTVHSVAGALPASCPLLDRAPFCAPHHTATVPAIVGGGSHRIRPGAASLAHRGVLFLDEAPEFVTGVLDALRQPLESGEIVIGRQRATVRFPAQFTLVLAANPCPCALATEDPARCTCSPAARRRYLGKLSGPLLDRVDLSVGMRQLSRLDLLHAVGNAEPSTAVAARVAAARERMVVRFTDRPWRTNAELPGRELRGAYAPDADALALAEHELARGRLTARGVVRVLRVAWSVADLAGHERPDADDVAVTLSLRHGAWAA